MYAALELNYGPYLPENKDARILDLGCGSGLLLEYLDFKGYTNILGVDVDEVALSKVDKKFKGNIKHINDLLVFLKSESKKFDMIIAKDVIYYFPPENIIAYMQSITAALNKDGSIIVEVFNGALLTAPYTAAKDFGIVNIFTEKSVRSVLESSLLQVDEVFGVRKIQRRGLKNLIYLLGVFMWHLILRSIFLLERGVDDGNPKILTKSIIAVGRNS